MIIRLYMLCIAALFLSSNFQLHAEQSVKITENNRVTAQAYDEFDQLADAAQEVAPAVAPIRAAPVKLTIFQEWKRNFLDFLIVQYLTVKKMLNKIF